MDTQHLQQESLAYQAFRVQAGRYFNARYGKDYVYRAPETFPSLFERWMLAITDLRSIDRANELMDQIVAAIERVERT